MDILTSSNSAQSHNLSAVVKKAVNTKLAKSARKIQNWVYTSNNDDSSLLVKDDLKFTPNPSDSKSGQKHKLKESM